MTEHQRGLPESQFQVKFRHSDDSVKSLDFGQLVWFDRFRSQAPNTIVFDIDHWKKPEGKDVLSLFSARREQLAIRSELERYCGPCPIPITLDSTPFHGLLHDFDTIDTDLRFPWCIQSWSDSEPMFTPPWSLQEVARANDVVCDSEVSGVIEVGLKLHPGRSPEAVESKASSSVLWVKHGVIADVTRLPFNSRILTVNLLLPAEDLASDLTGFRLIDGQQKLDRMKRGLKAVRSEFCDKFVAGSVEEMEYDSDRFKMPDPKKGPAMFVGLFAPMMAVGSLIAIFGIPMLSPLTIGVGAGLARTGFWANKNQPFKVPDKVFIRECQDWIEKDVRHLRSLAERS